MTSTMLVYKTFSKRATMMSFQTLLRASLVLYNKSEVHFILCTLHVRCQFCDYSWKRSLATRSAWAPSAFFADAMTYWPISVDGQREMKTSLNIIFECAWNFWSGRSGVRFIDLFIRLFNIFLFLYLIIETDIAIGENLIYCNLYTPLFAFIQLGIKYILKVP